MDTKNSQPTQIIRNKLPTRTYSQETLQFSAKIKFHISATTDEDYHETCKSLIKNQQCYTTRLNVVGQFKTTFQKRLKPSVKVQTQRPTRIPIHNGENKISHWFEKNTISVVKLGLRHKVHLMMELRFWILSSLFPKEIQLMLLWMQDTYFRALTKLSNPLARWTLHLNCPCKQNLKLQLTICTLIYMLL